MNINLNNVQINFFGKLTITTFYGSIDEDEINSVQMCKLITYLTLNRKAFISTDILTTILWPQGTEDPYTALRGLVYRLKKILRPIFPDESLIVPNKGSYIINNHFTYSVDAEQLSVISKHNISTTAAKTFLDSHCQPFMDILSSDIWGLPVCTFYNTRMITYTATATEKMLDENDLDNAVFYASKGLIIDPVSEELHNIIILALIRKGCRKIALNHYNNTLKMFEKEYGMKPTSKFRNSLNKILLSD